MRNQRQGFHKLVLQVVKNQIRANDPPETKETLERLLASGYSRKEAMKVIGAALTEEILYMMKKQKMYDRERLKAKFEKLR